MEVAPFKRVIFRLLSTDQGRGVLVSPARFYNGCRCQEEGDLTIPSSHNRFFPPYDCRGDLLQNFSSIFHNRQPKVAGENFWIVNFSSTAPSLRWLSSKLRLTKKRREFDNSSSIDREFWKFQLAQGFPTSRQPEVNFLLVQPTDEKEILKGTPTQTAVDSRKRATVLVGDVNFCWRAPRFPGVKSPSRSTEVEWKEWDGVLRTPARARVGFSPRDSRKEPRLWFSSTKIACFRFYQYWFALNWRRSSRLSRHSILIAARRDELGFHG